MRICSLESKPAGTGLMICLLWIAFSGCAPNSRVDISSKSEESQLPQEPSSVPAVDCEAELEKWRSYRLKQKDVTDIHMYGEGFVEGCTGPAGLVDRSHDFNLGHSDGMLAAAGKYPGDIKNSGQE